MDKTIPTYPRILAVSPTTFGFGIAVVEGVNTLVGCDIKRVRSNRNTGCINKIEKAIALYQPHVIVLEDSLAEDSGRSGRIRALTRRIIALAGKREIKVAVMSRKTVRAAFFAEGLGRKDALAKLLAERFPEELARHLPPERNPWKSEDRRMAMFEAVALALAFRHG